MQINTKNLVSMTEANQNFSKVARLVDENGTAVILKNNTPKYVVLEYSQFEQIENSTNEHIDEVARKVLAKNMDAFLELAK